jgi:hypothetical protein
LTTPVFDHRSQQFVPAAFHGGELLPPKAQAVLSTPPKKPTTLGRSPSKELGMLARKVSDAVSSSKTPKTRLSHLGEQYKWLMMCPLLAFRHSFVTLPDSEAKVYRALHSEGLLRLKIR